MINLLKKDYLFSKKILFYTALYCIAVPFILLLDQDGKIYLIDMLIPLALVTAPLATLLNKEDTKSGVIFQKTLPYSSFQKVGARFLFVFSLLFLGDIFVSGMKQIVFHSQNFMEAMTQSFPIFAGFAVYYAIYLTTYYWKGYFASQFCIYVLIVIVVFGKQMMGARAAEFVTKICSNKVTAGMSFAGVLLILYFVCCILEKRKKVDKL